MSDMIILDDITPKPLTADDITPKPLTADDITPKPLTAANCHGCGLPYDDPGFADLVVSNDVWSQISPTGDEGGLLCPTCMVRAAAKAGLTRTRAIFRSGPFTAFILVFLAFPA